MTSNRHARNALSGPLADVAGDAGYAEHPDRVGFFTDTSVCIGCKACEVACKEWNGLPEPGGDVLKLTGMSYDNTGSLGSDSWRHVAFIEQAVPADPHAAGGELISQVPGDAAGGDGQATRWLMASDVCKHCTHAACLDVCPTGALVRTEFGTVIVQPDVCNGCAYCVSACPFGVIDRREDDGRAWKCTMCYDRLRGGLEPACAKACPTDSIQFGPLDELRAIAQFRLEELHADGHTEARLYGESPEDGIGGAGAFFLLLDEPEVYGLPPDPVVTTRDLPRMWRWAGAAAAVLAAGVAVAFSGRQS
jgi:formate dehydrogenase iron-sulfur subunit